MIYIRINNILYLFHTLRATPPASSKPSCQSVKGKCTQQSSKSERKLEQNGAKIAPKWQQNGTKMGPKWDQGGEENEKKRNRNI